MKNDSTARIIPIRQAEARIESEFEQILQNLRTIIGSLHPTDRKPCFDSFISRLMTLDVVYALPDEAISIAGKSEEAISPEQKVLVMELASHLDRLRIEAGDQ